MKNNRRPLLAIIPAAALAGSMLTAPVAGAQSSLPIPEDLLGSASGSLNLGSLGEEPCGEKVVTPSNMGGWATPEDENEAKIVTTDDEDYGTGVLQMTPDEGQGTSLYKGANNVPLESLLDADDEAKQISYQYKGEGQAPALQIRVLNANVVDGTGSNHGDPYSESEDGFATIVWSPADGTADWQTATASNDQFWVTRPIVQDPEAIDEDGHLEEGNELLLERGKRRTLEEIIGMLGEDTVINSYGVQQTKDNETPTTQVDNFVFGCETTDFEMDPPGPDFGSLALGGGLALAAALAVGGGAFALQNGMIQLPPELAAMLPA